MKKLLCVILVLLAILMCCSCSKQDSADTVTVNFYYIKNEAEFGSDTPVLTKVARDIKAQEYSHTETIRIYLNGPTSYDCISPFPGGTELVDMHVDGTRSYVVLSPHIGTLTSVKQTVACACLARTVLELTQTDSVQIKIENELVCGKDAAVFHAESFAYLDSMTPDDAAK